jgi:diguanylate cyclase (GGDEF)-like protein
MEGMRLRFWLGLAAVAAIAVGSVVAALVIHSNENDAFERGQRDLALRAANQAEALAALSVGQLSTAAAFFQTKEDLTQREFDVLAETLLDSGALTATAFVEAVPREKRAEFERRRGVPIVERSPLGDFREAGDRRIHFPLSFAATKLDVGVTTPYGYDIGADPRRAPVILRARDKGHPAATYAMRLPLGGVGINVFHPVYAEGAATRTRAQRRGALVGFATGGFRVEGLAAAATEALPDEADAQLIERGQPVAGVPIPRDGSASASIRIADRTWLLVVHDPNRPGISLPVLMAAVGLSLAALLGSLILVWSRNERMRELRRQVGEDALTGLKNRRRFEEDLRTEMARSRRERVEGALLMIDLDNFKQVNDTLGHPVGDRLIGEIAVVLRGRTRETDVLARLGGDEFAVVLPRCDAEEARAVAGEIATAVREHVPRQDGVPPITASIGIAMFDGGGETSLETVVSEADAAMYLAKDAGRDAVRVFDPDTVRPAPGDS